MKPVSQNAGKKVSEILAGNEARIKNVRLPPGSPSWDDIMNLTWEEVVAKAQQREKGFRVFRKLLLDQRFDK